MKLSLLQFKLFFDLNMYKNSLVHNTFLLDLITNQVYYNILYCVFIKIKTLPTYLFLYFD